MTSRHLFIDNVEIGLGIVFEELTDYDKVVLQLKLCIVGIGYIIVLMLAHIWSHKTHADRRGD